MACIPHDIYVIGTQENSLGDREWVEFLCASLKTLMAIDYRVVTAGTARPLTGLGGLGTISHPPTTPTPTPRSSPTPNQPRELPMPHRLHGCHPQESGMGC